MPDFFTKSLPQASGANLVILVILHLANTFIHKVNIFFFFTTVTLEQPETDNEKLSWFISPNFIMSAVQLGLTSFCPHSFSLADILSPTPRDLKRDSLVNLPWRINHFFVEINDDWGEDELHLPYWPPQWSKVLLLMPDKSSNGDNEVI